ncbi:Hypothetical predicted protein [Lecanosticta acicola]|uniref:F-box domain-containing protein n=1 Tax=Lecanosticta acicola TaxID=111012 RepID=A0AAI8YZX0_9PEZI|nr:Hypothetical predicted protein [Lecanosticta acicola]
MTAPTFNNRTLSKEAWKAQQNRDMVEAMLLSRSLEFPSKIAKPPWATLDRETQHAIIDFLHSTKPRSLFLAKLPPEIRLIIYEYVLDGEMILPYPASDLGIAGDFWEPRFLRVCRTFRVEAMKLYCESVVSIAETDAARIAHCREMQRNIEAGNAMWAGQSCFGGSGNKYSWGEMADFPGAEKELKRMVRLGYIGTNPPGAEKELERTVGLGYIGTNPPREAVDW